MAIYSHRLARGQTRWMFTIDLPPACDGRRLQMNRKGFVSQAAAQEAETTARQSYARADLACGVPIRDHGSDQARYSWAPKTRALAIGI